MHMPIAIRAWDILFWITVLLPLITGGIWIDRPGIRIELAQVSIPLGALTLWAAFLMWRKPRALDAASSIRFLQQIWRVWQNEMDARPRRTLFLGFLFFGSLSAWVALERHWAFQTGYADLGIFLNAIWNLTHGNGYVSSVKNGMNLFADHQSPIFWLLAPIFRLLPRPEVLLIAQSFALSAGAPAVYLIGRQYLSRRTALLAALPLLYWAFNPVRNAARFDFHPETFMLPCFLFAIWAWQEGGARKKFVGGIFFVLALMGKESAGPVLAGVGFAWLMGAAPEASRRFCRFSAVPAILIGVAHLYVCTKIIPGQFAGAYQYQNMYAHFGEGLGALLLAPLSHPALFFEHLVGPERLRFLAGTLAPVSFLPLLSPTAFVAAVPGYLIYFMSSGSHRLSLGYHYAIESSVGVFWALAITMAKLENSSFLPRLPRWPLPYLIASLALICYGRSDAYFIRRFSAPSHHEWAKREVFPALPANAALMVNGYFVPHLANRPWIQHLPNLEVPGKGFVDCVVWSRHPSVNNSPMSDDLSRSLVEKMDAAGFKEIWSCDSLTVYQNPSYAEHCLPHPPECAGP